MKKEYMLYGMSFSDCVRNVKQELLPVPDVTEVEVHLNPLRAIITINNPIAVEEL